MNTEEATSVSIATVAWASIRRKNVEKNPRFCRTIRERKFRCCQTKKITYIVIFLAF